MPHLSAQQAKHVPVPLQILPNGIKQLRGVQLQSSKRTNQQRELLAMLLLAKLHGAALQEVRACATGWHTAGCQLWG
jgi:hypothetical protein